MVIIRLIFLVKKLRLREVNGLSKATSLVSSRSSIGNSDLPASRIHILVPWPGCLNEITSATCRQQGLKILPRHRWLLIHYIKVKCNYFQLNHLWPSKSFSNSPDMSLYHQIFCCIVWLQISSGIVREDRYVRPRFRHPLLGLWFGLM